MIKNCLRSPDVVKFILKPRSLCKASITKKLNSIFCSFCLIELSVVDRHSSLIDAPVTYSPCFFQFVIIWFGGITGLVTRPQMVVLIVS